MPVITGLTSTRMIAIENASITQAELDGDELVLTNYGGSEALRADVRGPQGPQGDPGPAGGGVLAGTGYTGDPTLIGALNQAKAYSDVAGLGIVAMSEYTADDYEKTGGDDSFHTVTNVTLTYNNFVAGRSYRFDFGIHVEFGVLSTIDNIISLDLREGSNNLRRYTIPGDEEGHTAGVGGAHIIKSCPWTGSKSFTMRFQKRTGAPVTIKNTVSSSFISLEDLGNRFA